MKLEVSSLLLVQASESYFILLLRSCAVIYVLRNWNTFLVDDKTK